MRLGATFPQTEIGSDPVAVRDFAQAVEAADYDYLLAYDHVLGADPTKHELTGPYTHRSMFHEPFVLFGYLAGLTQRIDLVTGIIILPQRQTAIVAKQAAEVDVLSGGRLILGIGIGWNQVEYEVLGADFHTRGRRSEEQVQLLRRLWDEELVTFEGEFDTVRDAGILPRPERHIPIWFGGGAASVLRRVGAYGDGWLPLGRGTPEEAIAAALSGFERIRGHAREAGRDPRRARPRRRRAGQPAARGAGRRRARLGGGGGHARHAEHDERRAPDAAAAHRRGRRFRGGVSGRVTGKRARDSW